MKRVKLGWICMPLLLSVPVLSQTVLRTGVFGSSCAGTAGTEYRICGTLGQALSGITQDASEVLEAGFWYQAWPVLTDVRENPGILPEKFRLEQNYPNPFNPTTTIVFAIPKKAHVTLKVYDTIGREVATLVNQEMAAGEYRVVFDASGLSSGVYFFRMRAEGKEFLKKLILLR